MLQLPEAERTTPHSRILEDPEAATLLKQGRGQYRKSDWQVVGIRKKQGLFLRVP